MVRFTDHLFPVVVFQAMGECGSSDIDAAEAAYRSAFQRGQRFISVSDARRSANHAAQRKHWADLTARLLEDTERWTVATVVILDSAALRAALTAVNWIVKPSIPQHIVKSPNDVGPTLRALAPQYQLAVPSGIDAEIQRWLAEGFERYDRSTSH
jgi:hypothetical protein